MGSHTLEKFITELDVERHKTAKEGFVYMGANVEAKVTSLPGGFMENPI